jgi:hypothetical protein
MVFRQTLTVFSGKVSSARSERGPEGGRGFLVMDQLERNGWLRGPATSIFYTALPVPAIA